MGPCRGNPKSDYLNSIRLTWAVEMVDDILDNGGDKDIRTAFLDVLGPQNGTQVFDAVMKNNPSFAPNITRLQVLIFQSVHYAVQC